MFTGGKKLNEYYICVTKYFGLEYRRQNAFAIKDMMFPYETYTDLPL